jgi:hypothetical protein
MVSRIAAVRAGLPASGTIGTRLSMKSGNLTPRRELCIGPKYILISGKIQHTPYLLLRKI